MKRKRGFKVLLIGGEFSNARGIESELKKIGYDSEAVVHAISGETGLEALQKEAFDLVLVDYSLPTVDGLEVLKRMQEMDLGIPVMMISSHAGERVGAEALKLGARNYILKCDLFSPKQTAALLGVTYQTIKNYIYGGRLKTYKTPGGHHRIRREDIMKLGFLEDGPTREEMVENYNELRQGYINTLGALTDALDARDGIVAGHSRRVANYVASLAEIMGICGKEQEGIKVAALLHDVGKVFIGEQILSKPGKLTDRERYFIRQHPEMGERVADGVEFLKDTKLHIRHHHERFDGKGYPDELSGEEIPLGARMISIAEAFDCITSDCTFQPKKGLREAAYEIEKNAGAQFDPGIARIFLEEVVPKLHGGDVDEFRGTYSFDREGRGEDYQYHVG